MEAQAPVMQGIDGQQQVCFAPSSLSLLHILIFNGIVSCDSAAIRILDERQITHLSCALLTYDLYDFFRGCFWAVYTRKRKEAGPKHPLKKSYRSYFRQAQIR